MTGNTWLVQRLLDPAQCSFLKKTFHNLQNQCHHHLNLRATSKKTPIFIRHLWCIFVVTHKACSLFTQNQTGTLFTAQRTGCPVTGVTEPDKGNLSRWKCYVSNLFGDLGSSLILLGMCLAASYRQAHHGALSQGSAH